MPLIDTVAYFVDLINIEGLSDDDSSVSGDSPVATWIPRHEKEYLIAALGYGFYKAFTDGLEEEEPAQRWVDLRDGKDYTVSGKTYRWNGFINDDLKSPIAYYAYCEYMTYNATSSTQTGEKVSAAQNSTNVSPSFKIQRAWDAMRELNESLWHFLDNNTTTYTEYDNSMVNWRELCGGRNMFGI